MISGAVFVFLSIGIIQIVDLVRSPIRTGAAPLAATWFGSVLRAKVVLRQAETRYCFQKVIDKHREQPLTATNQLFWLKGLVPRVLWPKKPSLSLGAGYSVGYCGSTVENQHSASITLLGQPIIHGGLIGLLLHGGLLVVGLGGVVWLARRPRSLATITSVALLPWLIDFDQDFAIYVANAVKFFLVMTPLVLLARRLAPRSRSS